MILIKEAQLSKIEIAVFADRPYFKTQEHKLLNDNFEPLDIGGIKKHGQFPLKIIIPCPP